MMIVVRDGTEEGRVGIAHWWPGRYYGGWSSGDLWMFDNPFPAYLRRRAYNMRSKYVTLVQVELPQGVISTFSICREMDQPSRAKGRFIALLRMGRLLKSMGLKMERVA